MPPRWRVSRDPCTTRRVPRRRRRRRPPSPPRASTRLGARALSRAPPSTRRPRRTRRDAHRAPRPPRARPRATETRPRPAVDVTRTKRTLATRDAILSRARTPRPPRAVRPRSSALGALGARRRVAASARDDVSRPWPHSITAPSRRRPTRALAASLERSSRIRVFARARERPRARDARPNRRARARRDCR